MDSDILETLTELAEQATDAQIRCVPGLAEAVAHALRVAADEDEADAKAQHRAYRAENPDDPVSLEAYAREGGWTYLADRRRADRLTRPRPNRVA